MEPPDGVVPVSGLFGNGGFIIAVSPGRGLGYLPGNVVQSRCRGPCDCHLVPLAMPLVLRQAKNVR